MPFLFPAQGILHDAFSSKSPLTRPSSPETKTVQSSRSVKDLFPTWSAVDDVKNKAGALSEEAQKEYQKATQAAQAKTGKIELYSAKYYAACTLGGLLACVWPPCKWAGQTAHILRRASLIQP